MTATNPHTGDSLTSKAPTDNYRDGWERIFGKKDVPVKDRPCDADPSKPCELKPGCTRACKTQG